MLYLSSIASSVEVRMAGGYDHGITHITDSEEPEVHEATYLYEGWCPFQTTPSREHAAEVV
jgi:hypothetical protein